MSIERNFYLTATTTNVDTRQTIPNQLKTFLCHLSSSKIFTIVKQWNNCWLEPSADYDDRNICSANFSATLPERSFRPLDDWDKLDSTISCLMTSCGQPSGEHRALILKSLARLNSVPATSGIFAKRLNSCSSSVFREKFSLSIE